MNTIKDVVHSLLGTFVRYLTEESFIYIYISRHILLQYIMSYNVTSLDFKEKVF